MVLSKLPKPDTHVEYTHSKFDELLTPFKPALAKWLNKPEGALQLKVVIKAEVRGSDIKWNDMAGTLCGSVRVDDKEICQLFSCNIVHFTGNCGIKSIDHLTITVPPLSDTLTAERKEFLKILESFVYHKTNCGYLIGSDTCTTQYKGRTLMNILAYGENYHVSDAVWNPNYTWSKDHKVAFFWKDLNKDKHVDYWQGGISVPMKGTSQEVAKAA